MTFDSLSSIRKRNEKLNRKTQLINTPTRMIKQAPILKRKQAIRDESLGLIDEAVQSVGLECRESIAAKLEEQNHLSRRNTRIFESRALDRLEVGNASKSQRQQPAQVESVINSSSSSSYKALISKPDDDNEVMEKEGELEYDISQAETA